MALASRWAIMNSLVVIILVQHYDDVKRLRLWLLTMPAGGSLETGSDRHSEDNDPLMRDG